MLLEKKKMTWRTWTKIEQPLRMCIELGWACGLGGTSSWKHPSPRRKTKTSKERTLARVINSRSCEFPDASPFSCLLMLITPTYHFSLFLTRPTRLLLATQLWIFLKIVWAGCWDILYKKRNRSEQWATERNWGEEDASSGQRPSTSDCSP